MSNNHPNRKRRRHLVTAVTDEHRKMMVDALDALRDAEHGAIAERVRGVSPFDANGPVHAAMEAVRMARRFAVSKSSAVDPSTGAIVGQIVWLSDSNNPHDRTDCASRDAVLNALIADAEPSLCGLRRLLAQADAGVPWFGPRGEAQHTVDGTGETLGILGAMRVRPTDAVLDAIQAAADDVRTWKRYPYDASRMPLVDAEVARLRAIKFSAGRHTLAARRAIDGDAVEMILGAMM